MTNTGPNIADVDRSLLNEALGAFSAGKIDLAHDRLITLVERYPTDATLRNNLGVVKRRLGDKTAAEACYRTARAINPAHADTAYNLGNLLRERGEHAASRLEFAEAVRLDPNHAAAWVNLGCATRDLELYEESHQALIRAAALRPDDAETQNNLAVTLWKRKKYVAADAHYRRAVALAPTDSRFIANHGVCLMEQEKYDQAEARLRRALELKPENADYLGYLGQCLTGAGKLDEALVVFERALARDEDHLDSNLGRARALLLKGDMERGWPAYAWRWKRMELAGGVPDNPWCGEDLNGKSLHLLAEQGVGDIVQFLRYVPILEEMGAQVSINVPDALRRIAATVSPKIRLITDLQPVPKVDYACALLDVPEVLNTRLDSIPADTPYLSVPDEARRDLPKRGRGKHVGLVWAGNPEHKRDMQRSVPLEKMLQLTSVANICWYSLQKGDRSADRDRLGVSAVIPDIVAQAEDFADTAALIEQLDLVVTVDTSVAHMAGALGKPVWVLIQFAPDWRWMLDRNDTPWYPSMRLFRMGKHQDVTELKRALEEFAAQ